MYLEDYRELIELLIKATKEGRVHWTPPKETGIISAFEVDDFVVSTPDYTIEIGWFEDEDEDEDEKISFTISAPSGRSIYNMIVAKSNPDFDIISELFEFAKRKAANIDLIVHDIHTALSEGKEIGKPPTRADLPRKT